MSRIYPCVYCTDDLHCTKYTDDNYESWCVLGPCKDEKPSNADRIRAMTDAELAEWINHMQADAYNRGMLEDWIVRYPNNYSAWLDWLRQEAQT